MKDNKVSITSIIVGIILIAAIVVGILFATGVLSIKKGTQLPITYPNNTINWVVTKGGEIRASFEDELKITQEDIIVRFTVNDLQSTGARDGDEAVLELREDKDLPYIKYDGTTSISVEVAEDTYEEYSLSITIYNNASLTESGDITSGDGFVLEFSNFCKYDEDSSAYLEAEITSFKVLSIYESADNVALL